MIDPVILLTFVPAALALNLTPGADMLFCLGQGLRAGPRAAVAASAGISLGSMVHVTLAGLGLGAAVAAMPWLFDVIRWVGVGYLLYLAWGAIGHRPEPASPAPGPARRAFRDGLLVNLANPKVILFVLAFIPQFVDPAAGPILPQFLMLGAVIALGGFVINAGVGLFAGGAGRRLTGNPSTRRALGWLSGGIFAALALRLAIIERA
ncbi:Threonine/homoserine/homoserine lactone efflux protein [Cribrihabitans marinus]|uniref:Threonine/homoserine/homoserine lactone efflux protein n=1 Tax=Cribrihabitans marinus TaxID=1227549 RepID=A0A1H7CFB3_9RHOB|nr:LysE family translocator [Cribrihabitans marinus]GGH35081.1 threonine transporter RhtB [Cribrihabitans marinus]SEJ87277.1 Threonine/homoserine/homoserine lactone efflux protein [Cribrihabitans marinus]